jgi:competence protein ComEC
MKLLNFTIIKLTICLVIGIVLAHDVNTDLHTVLYATIGVLLLIGFYWVCLRKKIDRGPLFGLLTYLCMIGIGIISYSIQNEKLQPNHYTNLNISQDFNSIIFKIEERLKPDNYNTKYIVSVNSFNDETASGKLLINIKHDSLNSTLSVDDLLFSSSKLQAIQKPLNPHQFDYSNYLELKQVYHQLYLKQDELLLLSDSKTTIYGFADELRTRINRKLVAAGFKNEAISGEISFCFKTNNSSYVFSFAI